MSITLQFDEISGYVSTTAHGILAVKEIEAHVQDKAAANVLSKPEIFDARDVTLDLSVQDLRHIAGVVRETMGSQKPGPIAIVTNSAFIECLARAYAAMTVKQNPSFRVFNTIADAQAWVTRKSAK